MSARARSRRQPPSVAPGCDARGHARLEERRQLVVAVEPARDHPVVHQRQVARQGGVRVGGEYDSSAVPLRRQPKDQHEQAEDAAPHHADPPRAPLAQPRAERRFGLRDGGRGHADVEGEGAVPRIEDRGDTVGRSDEDEFHRARRQVHARRGGHAESSAAIAIRRRRVRRRRDCRQAPPPTRGPSGLARAAPASCPT